MNMTQPSEDVLEFLKASSSGFLKSTALISTGAGEEDLKIMRMLRRYALMSSYGVSDGEGIGLINVVGGTADDEDAIEELTLLTAPHDKAELLRKLVVSFGERYALDYVFFSVDGEASLICTSSAGGKGKVRSLGRILPHQIEDACQSLRGQAFEVRSVGERVVFGSPKSYNEAMNFDGFSRVLKTKEDPVGYWEDHVKIVHEEIQLSRDYEFPLMESIDELARDDSRDE